MRVQIQDKAVFISFQTNAFEKDMNPFLLSTTMGKN